MVARALEGRHDAADTAALESISAIVSAACLAHDMGNPPFGHSGEEAICSFFSEGAGQQYREFLPESTWNDITHFDGNANTFRLLTHRFNGRRKRRLRHDAFHPRFGGQVPLFGRTGGQ